VRDSALKAALKTLFFRDGAVRRIRLGPLRGLEFQISDITGISPWYSDAERHHQAAFRRLIHPDDCIIDVGANWGLHTLFFSKLVSPSGRVISCEPYPPAFAALRWHVTHNGLRNVVTIDRGLAARAAVSNTVARAAFSVNPSPSQGGLSQVTSAASAQSLVVKTTTIDALIEELSLSSLKLVKIDVEGADHSSWRGPNTPREHCSHFSLSISIHRPSKMWRSLISSSPGDMD
jgi:FkbM family methyltransferase